jgi:cytochrome c5
MSDAHDAANHAPHEGPIKTPKQLVVTVIASFVIPIVVIILLINYVAFGNKSAAGTSALEPQAVAERIMPVGGVMLKAASGGGELKTGEQVFQARCSACHAAGALGAPKFGDAAAWGPRIKTGFDALWNSALKGKNSMTAQGGGEFSDYEIARAVVYMANKGGANFPEPKAPAAK